MGNTFRKLEGGRSMRLENLFHQLPTYRFALGWPWFWMMVTAPLISFPPLCGYVCFQDPLGTPSSHLFGCRCDASTLLASDLVGCTKAWDFHLHHIFTLVHSSFILFSSNLYIFLSCGTLTGKVEKNKMWQYTVQYFSTIHGEYFPRLPVDAWKHR